MRTLLKRSACKVKVILKKDNFQLSALSNKAAAPIFRSQAAA